MTREEAHVHEHEDAVSHALTSSINCASHTFFSLVLE